MEETSIWKGASTSASGAGIYSRMVSNRGFKSLPASSGWTEAVPCRPEQNSMGESSCSSVAFRSMSSSSTSSMTSYTRWSGRSILLTTTMTRWPSSRALDSTKRVWGMGPSAASTSRMTPLTIFRMRSTSPPKSAWPGVSTMLIFTSL